MGPQDGCSPLCSASIAVSTSGYVAAISILSPSMKTMSSPPVAWSLLVPLLLVTIKGSAHVCILTLGLPRQVGTRAALSLARSPALAVHARGGRRGGRVGGRPGAAGEHALRIIAGAGHVGGRMRHACAAAPRRARPRGKPSGRRCPLRIQAVRARRKPAQGGGADPAGPGGKLGGAEGGGGGRALDAQRARARFLCERPAAGPWTGRPSTWGT